MLATWHRPDALRQLSSVRVLNHEVRMLREPGTASTVTGRPCSSVPSNIPGVVSLSIFLAWFCRFALEHVLQNKKSTKIRRALHALGKWYTAGSPFHTTFLEWVNFCLPSIPRSWHEFLACQSCECFDESRSTRHNSFWVTSFSSAYSVILFSCFTIALDQCLPGATCI